MKDQIVRVFKLREEYYTLAYNAIEKFKIKERYESESEEDSELEFKTNFCARIDSLWSTVYSVSYALGIEKERVEVELNRLSCLLDMLNELDAVYDSCCTEVTTQEDIVSTWIAETFVYAARMHEFNLDELLEEVKTIKENVYKLLE